MRFSFNLFGGFALLWLVACSKHPVDPARPDSSQTVAPEACHIFLASAEPVGFVSDRQFSRCKLRQLREFAACLYISDISKLSDGFWC